MSFINNDNIWRNESYLKNKLQGLGYNQIKLKFRTLETEMKDLKERIKDENTHVNETKLSIGKNMKIC